ncbi:hypothetical protein FJM65_00565 [Pontibacter mangrovi]|uniref:DUF7710 domain-containing protein n=1 Tax=Pontibacter mangrovi TaxID=2589816 RepID=A0A501WD76_9BACT|nr:hypothetical protein FJM65_00565 [Pontibacter mangrovi]
MKVVWVFNTSNSSFSGGIFEDFEVAEAWIKKNKLTGTLTKYPLNKGTLEWAIENDCVGIKPEKLKEKMKSPEFIGGFTSASMEHYHYEAGYRD